MNTTLESLLDAGKTPESIYQDCLDIIRERNAKAAKEKEKQEKLDLAKDQVVQAMENLFKAAGMEFDKYDEEITYKLTNDLVAAAERVKPVKQMVKKDPKDVSDEEFLRTVGKALGVL